MISAVKTWKLRWNVNSRWSFKMLETIVYSLMIAGCGYIIGNIKGYTDGLAKGQEIVKEAYDL
jgi:hypothetical protein